MSAAAKLRRFFFAHCEICGRRRFFVYAWHEDGVLYDTWCRACSSAAAGEGDAG